MSHCVIIKVVAIVHWHRRHVCPVTSDLPGKNKAESNTATPQIVPKTVYLIDNVDSSA